MGPLAGGGRAGAGPAGDRALLVAVDARHLRDARAAADAPQSDALVLPEALPDDIATAARALWREGRPRHALALLYRASVESMSQRADIALPPGATEAECLRAS